MRRAPGSRVLAALLPLLCCPLAALAIDDEIQVYIDDVNEPGEYGLETHINTTPRGRRTPDYAGEMPPYRGLRATPEFSRGLTANTDIGLYLPAAMDADGKWSSGSYKLRFKWIPIRGGEDGGWYLGSNHELGWLRPEYSESRREYELRLIGGYRAKGWLIGANAVLEYGLTRGHRGSPEVTLAWKAVHDVVPGVALGAEFYHDIGTLAQRLPGDQQGRTLFAIAEIERRGWGLNLGIGHGLTSATDNWTVKAIIEVSFN